MLNQLGGIAFFVLVILLTAGAIWMVPWADRRRIRRMIEEQGGVVVDIRRSTPSLLRRLLSERNTTFWQVQYQAPDGTARVAECFASFLRCKVCSDEQVQDRLE